MCNDEVLYNAGARNKLRKVHNRTQQHVPEMKGIYRSETANYKYHTAWYGETSDDLQKSIEEVIQYKQTGIGNT